MGAYTLKVYRRQRPREFPGELVGEFVIAADDSDAAVARARADYAAYLADCDYAFIGADHGRIVWETKRTKGGDTDS